MKRMKVFFPSYYADYPGCVWDLAFTFEREESCLGWPIYSSVFVCPVCCEVWAKTEVEGDSVHEARGVCCPTCIWDRGKLQFLSPVPGSLLDNWTCGGVDWPMLDAMPPDLLYREFELTLKAWDSHPW